MELIETLIITLQLTSIVARRKYKGLSSSEESIENILYYKDCNYNKKKDPALMKLREPLPPPPKPQECKMSCTMCCGDDCVHNQQTIPGRQRPPMRDSPMPKPMPREPNAPNPPPIRPRKKKFKESLLPPIGGRRDFGFTRENIKTLISQDEDIKKILKDLVKVTMQKVDLVEMIKASRNQVDGSEVPIEDSDNDEELE